ncbi:MAG: glycosyltransferase [Candidatus Bathyarchaeia archaeon]
MHSTKPFIIACIPFYNEEATIAKVVIQAQKHVDKVIVCDDGSNDYTGLIAERFRKGVALKSLFKKEELALL